MQELNGHGYGHLILKVERAKPSNRDSAPQFVRDLSVVLCVMYKAKVFTDLSAYLTCLKSYALTVETL